MVKVKRPGLLPDGSTPEVPGIGVQITDHSVDNDRSQAVTITWKAVVGRYPDGTRYQLRRPQLSFSKDIKVRGRFVASLRIATPLIGLGLLEAVPAATLFEMSDSRDRDRDGISGRINFVKDAENDSYTVGRFGFKATTPSVRQQSGTALYHDMGITNPVIPEETQELSAEQLTALTAYQQLGGVPQARSQNEPQVLHGKEIFKRIGCDSCHRMTLTTGAHEHPELANQVIHPFTDLLLHDMGPELADSWNEFSARGAEWRTTPLWGLGFAERLNQRSLTYLHDGRARSIEEAILWHGGESATTRDRFKHLTKLERERLVAFLRSL